MWLHNVKFRLALAGALVAVAIAAALTVPRLLHSSDTPFSVVVPPGWNVVSGKGQMLLRGPGKQQVEITWIDGPPVKVGFINATDQLVRNIPVTVGGQPTYLADSELIAVDGTSTRAAFLDGISHSFHGRSVGFTVHCDPGTSSDTSYSSCLAILRSWRWE